MTYAPSLSLPHQAPTLRTGRMPARQWDLPQLFILLQRILRRVVLTVELCDILLCKQLRGYYVIVRRARRSKDRTKDDVHHTLSFKVVALSCPYRFCSRL